MNANLRMKNIADEYDILADKYKELKEKAETPNTVYLEKRVVQEVAVPQRIGNEVDRMFDMY